jgi:hypothetical protein
MLCATVIVFSRYFTLIRVVEHTKVHAIRSDSDLFLLLPQAVAVYDRTQLAGGGFLLGHVWRYLDCNTIFSVLLVRV